jgi:molybdopterin converting factor small subunit
MPALRNFDAAATVEIELFGVPRVLTGERSVQVAARTLGEVAEKLGIAYPALLGTVLDRDHCWLLSGYTFVVDDCFSRSPETAVSPGVPVFLVSSVAGG